MRKSRQGQRYEEKLTDEAETLNKYLSQYRYCISKKKSLEHRREEIMTEFNNPLSSVHMNGISRGSSVGVGCAAISFRLDEIDTKIREQIEQATKILSDIMNVIDFLPENTLERAIIENRYIDRFSWEQVCKENHAGRSTAIRYWKKGLHELLEFEKIKQMMKEYEMEGLL